MLNSKRNTYVLTQTDCSSRKLRTLCSSIKEQKLAFLMSETILLRKRILFWSNTLKIRACSGKKFKIQGLFWIFESEKSTLVGGTYPYTYTRH